MGRKIIIILISWNCILNICLINALAGQQADYYAGLKSKDVNDRISALIKINLALDKGDMKIDDKVKATCYGLIQDEIEGKNAGDDEEGNYSTQLLKLSIKINDQKVLPYLIRYSGSELAKIAIAKQGDIAANELLKMATNLKSLNMDQQRSIIEIFSKMVKVNKNEYTAAGETRVRVKKAVIEIIKYNQELVNKNLQASDKGKYFKRSKQLGISLKIPALKFFQLLGDVDVMPFIEEMYLKDDAYDDVPEQHIKDYQKAVNGAKTTQTEREALLKAQVDSTASGKPTKTIRRYFVREEGQKVLAELKKNYGLK